MERDYFACFAVNVLLHKKYLIKINVFVLRLMGNKLSTCQKLLKEADCTFYSLCRFWEHY